MPISVQSTKKIYLNGLQQTHLNELNEEAQFNVNDQTIVSFINYFKLYITNTIYILLCIIYNFILFNFVHLKIKYVYLLPIDITHH